jgi:hypothetical protein
LLFVFLGQLFTTERVFLNFTVIYKAHKCYNTTIIGEICWLIYLDREYNSHKILHKTFFPSVLQNFINLILLFTLHVSASIGHLQVFYLLWLKLLLVLPFMLLKFI